MFIFISFLEKLIKYLKFESSARRGAVRNFRAKSPLNGQILAGNKFFIKNKVFSTYIENIG